MPAPLDVNKDAVKAHALQHGIRPTAEHFGLQPGTVGKWSERDPEGPWCPKQVSTPIRAATVQPSNGVNSVNSAPVAARNAEQHRAHRSKLNAHRYVDRTLHHAASVAHREPETALELADRVKAVVSTAQASNMPEFEREAQQTRVAVNILHMPPPERVIEVEAQAIT
jgi:hypothetical protein